MNLETLRKLNESGLERTRKFSFPHELIDDPSLSMREKRAILAEWASDACAIESFPTLRLLPGTTLPVTLSSIMDALVRLDDDSESENNSVAPTIGLLGTQTPRRSVRRHGADCAAYEFSRDRAVSAKKNGLHFGR
jgi:hypothetical protein